MAKLKLWVKNLIISLALVLSVAGVGVGLYFVFQPKASPEPEYKRELTPEQKQFIEDVSQNEQIDVDYEIYNSLVLDDGEHQTPIGIDNIIGKFGKYYVTDVDNNVEIYKQAESGDTSLVSETTNNSLTLSKVEINEDYSTIYSKAGEYQISGDYAILKKADDSLFVASLITGDKVLDQTEFDVVNIDEEHPVGSWTLEILDFENNFLVLQYKEITRFVSEADFSYDCEYRIYHLGNVEHPLIFDDNDIQLLGYSITESYIQIVSSEKTSVYSNELGDNGELVLLLTEYENTTKIAEASEEVVAEFHDNKYSELKYTTIQFVPDTNYVLVKEKTATTSARTTANDQGVAMEQYDGIHGDALLSNVFVGVNYKVFDSSINAFLENVALSGNIVAVKSSIDGYIELFDVSSNVYQYYNRNFVKVVSYNALNYGEVVYYANGVFYTAGDNTMGLIDPWGRHSSNLTAWNLASSNVFNAIAVVQSITSDNYALYNIETNYVYECSYKFASQIMHGYVIVYEEETEENSGAGFYLINLNNMRKTPIADFDLGSLNLVAGSVGFYFTKNAETNRYTLHYFAESGIEIIENIVSYDFSGALDANNVKVPQDIDGRIYVELSAFGETSKRIIVCSALGGFLALSDAQIAEEYPCNIDESENSGANAANAQIIEKTAVMVVNSQTDYSGLKTNTKTITDGDNSVTLEWSGEVPVYTIDADVLGFQNNPNAFNNGSTNSGAEEYDAYGMRISNRTSLDDIRSALGVNYPDNYIYSMTGLSFGGSSKYIETPHAFVLMSEQEGGSSVIIGVEEGYIIDKSSGFDFDEHNGIRFCASAAYGQSSDYIENVYGGLDAERSDNEQLNRVCMGYKGQIFGYTFPHDAWDNSNGDMGFLSGRKCDLPVNAMAYPLKDQLITKPNYRFQVFDNDNFSKPVSYNSLILKVMPYKQTMQRNFGYINTESGQSTGAIPLYDGNSDEIVGWNTVDLTEMDRGNGIDNKQSSVVGIVIKSIREGYSVSEMSCYIHTENNGNWTTQPDYTRPTYDMKYSSSAGVFKYYKAGTRFRGDFERGAYFHCEEASGLFGWGADWWNERIGQIVHLFVKVSHTQKHGGGKIYVAQQTTQEVPNSSHYIQGKSENGSGNSLSILDVGERVYYYETPYSSANVGFVKNVNYMNSGQHIGDIRNNLSKFGANSTGFAYAGHYTETEGGTQKCHTDGSLSGTLQDVTSSLYPRQYAHKFSIFYHYSDETEGGSDVLPYDYSNNSNLVVDGSIKNAGIYDKNPSACTIYFNEPTNSSNWIWPNENAGNGGSNTSPYGYTFTKWLAIYDYNVAVLKDGTVGGGSVGKNELSNARELTVSSQSHFGWLNNGSTLFYAPNADKKGTDSPTCEMQLYAIYTPKQYKLELRIPEQTTSDMHLALYGNGDMTSTGNISAETSTSKLINFATGSVKLNTMWVTDGAIYEVVNVYDNYYKDTLINHASRPLSFAAENDRKFLSKLYDGSLALSLNDSLSAYTDLRKDINGSVKTDSNNRILSLNVTTPVMEYYLSFSENDGDELLSRDHVYGDSGYVHTALGQVQLNTTLSGLGEQQKDGYHTTVIDGVDHVWKSGGNDRNDKIVYDNFLAGYRIDIAYKYLDSAGTKQTLNADFSRTKTGYTHKEVTFYGLETQIVFDVDAENKLTITFYNYYGYYHSDKDSATASATKGVFGDAGGTQSKIIVAATISTLPYDIDVEIDGETKHYSTSGQPTDVDSRGFLNNSVSEAYNGRYNKAEYNKALFEQLGRGSTALVNIGNNLYHYLHTRYYVPDSFVKKIVVSSGYNTAADDLIFEPDENTMRRLAIEMGKTYVANEDCGIRWMSGWKMFDTTDQPIIGTADADDKNRAQINALLKTMYGMTDGKINVQLNADGSATINGKDSPVSADNIKLLYYIVKFGTGDAYFITTKFVDMTDTDGNNKLGVATAILFNIDHDWVENASYTINIETAPINFGLSVEIVGDGATHQMETAGDNAGFAKADNGEIKFDSNNSYRGTPLKDGEDEHVLLSELADDQIVPSMFLTFDVSAKKGYYFDEVKITLNEYVYVITFDGLTIDQANSKFAPIYKVTRYNAALYDPTHPADNKVPYEKQTGTTYPAEYGINGIVNSDGSLRLALGIDENSTLYCIGYMLLNIRLNACLASAENINWMNIELGYIHENNAKISVHYNPYTLIRVESDNEIDNDENTAIGYHFNSGNIVVEKEIGTILTIYDNSGDRIFDNVYALAQQDSAGTYEQYAASADIAARNSQRIYFFVCDYKVASTDTDKITIISVNDARATYQIETQSGNGYKNNIANVVENKPADVYSDNDAIKTHLKVDATMADGTNKNNVVSIVVKPKHIATTIKADIDYDGIKEKTGDTVNEYGAKYHYDSQHIYEETSGAAADKKLDYAIFYEVNEGQIASGGTTYTYRNANYSGGLYDTKNYVKTENGEAYGTTVDRYGNIVKINIATQYGYVYDGLTISVTFNNGADDVYFVNLTNSAQTSETAVTVAKTGITPRYIGRYKFESNEFTLYVDNLAIETLSFKLHYAAKTFEMTYDTHQDFGSSAVNETEQVRTFVYNVVSDVNYGTSYLATNISKAGSFGHPTGEPTSQNDGVNYTRVGYDQVGWAFGTAYFAKLLADGEGRLKGQTSNMDTYINGVTEDNYSTYEDFATIRALIETYPAIYLTALYKVGRYDVKDAGYAWYLSLGKDFDNVFENNTVDGASATATMYAIWNAKQYSINVDYNDSTTLHDGAINGSSEASKFVATWVFDQAITIKNFGADDLKFAVAGDSINKSSTNQISNTYRLGYTFDGWYFDEGTFNGADGWADLIYQNDYHSGNKNAILATNSGGSAVLNEDVYKHLVTVLNNELKVWRETPDEYDESAVDYAHRKNYSSVIDVFAKWSANVYTFVYDLNTVTNNEGDGAGENAQYGNFVKMNALNGTVSWSKNQTGVGTSYAYYAESGKTVVQVTFDTMFSGADDWFKAYAYRYGYQFAGWYATRNSNTGDADHDRLLENQLLDVDLLMYLMNNIDSGIELEISTKDELTRLREKAGTNVGVTNIADSIDKASGIATNVSDNNKIMLHARWHALSYTINFDLNNEGHIDYEWNDADYAVAGKETGNRTNPAHLVNSSWITFEVIFDQEFGNGVLNIDTSILRANWQQPREKTLVHGRMYRDVGKDCEFVFHDSILRYSHYGEEKTATGSDFEILTQILYSYGYTLGIKIGEGESAPLYYFTLVRTTEGFDQAKVGDIDYDIKADTKFNNKYLRYAKYERTEVDSSSVLEELDAIDYSGHGVGTEYHIGDQHLNNNDASAVFGERNVTIFAYWTQKLLTLRGSDASDNCNNNTIDSTVEQYSNYLQPITNQTKQIIDVDNAHYDEKQLTETTTTLKFWAPTGQYVSQLYIDLYDDRMIFDTATSTYISSRAKIGRLTITFEWDSITRTNRIISAAIDAFITLEGGRDSAQTITFVYGDGATASDYVIVGEDLRSVTSGDDKDLAYRTTIDFATYEAFLRHIAQNIVITTSKYTTNDDSYAYWKEDKVDNQGGVNNVNINNSYLLSSEKLNGVNYDINVVTVTFTSLKSQFVISAENKAQTYQVDYYRYIRPSTGYKTKIGDDIDDPEHYGKEYWDSEFYNSWDQYLVYQQLEYRYGEYASLAYGYASNFSFENWYYYQGHVYAHGEYVEYANYNYAGSEAYETHESSADSIGYDHLLDEFGYWTVRAYNWVWTDPLDHELGGEYVYVDPITGDVDIYGNTLIDNRESITIHQYHRYNQASGRMYENTAEPTVGLYNNKTYEYDRKPIRGNTSLICLYVPSTIHRVHYYSWDVNGGYVDRTASSREYIMGEKKDAKVYYSEDGIDKSVTCDTWVLGNNAEYYYVGYHAFDNFVESTGMPTISAAFEFLLQFVRNSNDYLGGELTDEHIYDDNGIIAINWGISGNNRVDLKTILDHGICLNGVEYLGESYKTDDGAQQYAVNLLRALAQTYSKTDAKRIYGFNGTYMSDVDVIKNMTFYADIASQIDVITNAKPHVVAHKEVSGDYKYYISDEIDASGNPIAEATQFGEEEQAAYVISQRYRLAVFNVVYKHLMNTSEDILEAFPDVPPYPTDVLHPYKESWNITRIFPAYSGTNDAATSALESAVSEIVNKLNAKDLSILIDSVSKDYFGFILNNPTAVVNQYPSGDNTYFAGWYLVDGDLYDYMMSSINKNLVLTFDSASWNLDEESYQTLDVSEPEYHPEDGTITYSLTERNKVDGKLFTVSRFHTIDQLTRIIDKLSRVENDIYVFAAFNCFRFEFKEDGEDIVMTDSELQWGSRVEDLNGDPYQYDIHDTHYVALDEYAFGLFAEAVKKNNNPQTALRDVLENVPLSHKKENLPHAEKVISEGNVQEIFSVNKVLSQNKLPSGKWFILAYVENVISIVPSTIDSRGYRVVTDGVINKVSSNLVIVDVDGDNVEVKDLNTVINPPTE